MNSLTHLVQMFAFGFTFQSVFLDESKAEKQKQALKPFHAPFQPKLEDKIRFQMNLKKTLEKAQMSKRCSHKKNK